MKKTTLATLFVLVLAGFASTLQAAEENAAGVKTEKVNYVSAVSIDFNKELDLDFPGLVTLGARIETALKDTDPVSLAACGLELKAAEAAAEKTASYTSKKVLNDAYELAFDRAESAELKAVKVLLPEKAKDLDKVLEMLASNTTARGFRTLHVDNDTSRHYHVFFNGRNFGCVHGNQHSDINWDGCIHERIRVEFRLPCGHVAYRLISVTPRQDLHVHITSNGLHTH